MYEKDSQKIITYVKANLNYENIKNIYFSYKISEILNSSEIEFDIELTQKLVQDIYSEQHHEFYTSTNRDVIEHENFYWICEMARNSDVEIETTYSSSIELSSSNHIEVSIDNLILHDFGTYVTFKFESDQLRTHILTKQSNGNHVADIFVPLDSLNYPLIEGYLRAYEGSNIISEQYISFSTTYFLEHNLSIQEELNIVQFSLNVSIICNGTQYSLESGSGFAEIYIDDTLSETQPLSHQRFIEHSMFNLSYEISNETEYTFYIYLNDGISNETHSIGEIDFNTNTQDNSDNPDNPDNPDVPDTSVNYDREIRVAIPLTIIFFAAPGIVVISNRKLKNSKNHLIQK